MIVGRWSRDLIEIISTAEVKHPQQLAWNEGVYIAQSHKRHALKAVLVHMPPANGRGSWVCQMITWRLPLAFSSLLVSLFRFAVDIISQSHSSLHFHPRTDRKEVQFSSCMTNWDDIWYWIHCLRRCFLPNVFCLRVRVHYSVLLSTLQQGWRSTKHQQGVISVLFA